MEAKIDALLRINGGDSAEQLIADLDRHYLRHDGPSPHGHDAELVRSAGRDVDHVATAR